jgi:membrane protease YdiL (CAAX protease family)
MYSDTNQYAIERPEDIEQVNYESPENIDKKWYGVPPKGWQPLPGKSKYILIILGIIILEIGIWAIYRLITGPILGLQFGDPLFYYLHIIAAPTIHLLPIILIWKYYRKEPSHPFTFTKKLLLTGIIVGFTAAIIWRLLEQFTYDGVAGLAGGTVPNTRTFYNLLETPFLFGLMTFVMYFIVGPVEELEFRGFAQDQAARVLPNYQALIFSSVLFGCSHIPIAIFIYQLPPTQFIDALIGWIAAGFTFGALYMWSRNIFACIVMHGMGNWQLSVFYFQSDSAGMSATAAMGVGITTSIVSNAIMIVIFYLIHKYYWEPQRRGEPAFGGRLFSVQKFFYKHDFERKPLYSTVFIFVIFIMVVSGMIMSSAVNNGVVFDTGTETPVEDGEVRYMISHETRTTSGYLYEGENEQLLYFSEQEKYVKEVWVNLTWSDEADIIGALRTFQNAPDTFSVSVSGINASNESTAANPQGEDGIITTGLAFTNEEITDIVSSMGENFGITVQITLVDVGVFPIGALLYGSQDTGNEFSAEITIVWAVPR